VLSKAKEKARTANCLSNLHQIDLGMRMYLSDYNDTFPPGDTKQFTPSISDAGSPQNYLIGNYLGGNDPNPINSPRVPLAKDRLLNPYVSTRQTWTCPSDHGWGKGLYPTTASVLGDSYRFNWGLDGDYYRTSGVAEDAEFNLGLKKESWVPDLTRFIMFHDMAVYPWQNFQNGTVEISQWHNTANPGKIWNTKTINSNPEKMVGTIAFVDGHAQLCDFSPIFKKDLARGLEPGKDWMWYKPRK